MKVFALIGEAKGWCAWICHTVIQWMLQRWFTRAALSFIICNVLYYIIAVKDVVDVSVRGYRLAKIVTRKCIKRGRRLPHLCCVYGTVYASCVISVTRAGLLDIIDGMANCCGNVLYEFFVDPLSRLMADSPIDVRNHHRTHGVFGIPGRHNGRRAGKRGRARPPPFRRSCHRKHRPSVLDVPVDAPPKEPGELPPRRLARQLIPYGSLVVCVLFAYSRRFQNEMRRRKKLRDLHYFLDPDKDNPISPIDGLTHVFLPQIDFSWWQPEYSPFVDRFRYERTDKVIKPSSRFQEWTARIQECTKLIQWGTQECTSIFQEIWWQIQECTAAFRRCPIYSDAIIDESSTTHRRSENGDTRNLHTYIFIGKPSKGNDQSNVHISPKVARMLRRRSKGKQINITGDDGKTHAEWLVGDSGAGCSVIANEDLLTDIAKAPNNRTMTIHCNSGTTTIDQMGTLIGFGRVWFNPNGIANIVSLSEISKKHRVTMDSTIDNAIYVHKSDGGMRRFECTKSGIYCCNLRGKDEYMFNITTVEGQELQYSKLDVARAKKARKLQEVMGFISERDMLNMIDKNLIIGSKVRRRDVLIANDIYGPNTNSLKGKTVRKTENHVREDSVMDVPKYIMDRYRDVTLSADIMHINGVSFFVAISRHIKHVSIIPISKRNRLSMLSCVDKLIAAYEHRGFKIKSMFMDNAFECLREDLRGHDRNIDLNCVAADEHEPNIERCIRHVKERCRCVFASLNFKRLPRRLITELASSTVYWINCCPRSDGVHPTLSPRAILTGQVLTEKNVEFQFGDFLQPTEPSRTNATKNSMDERTCDAIYCRPSGNAQGGFLVYKLSTAQLVHRNTAVLAHSSDAIAEQVEAIAANEKMPSGIAFGDRLNNPTILDFDTDPGNDQEDDISDDEYSDHDDQLEDDHDLPTYYPIDQNETDDGEQSDGDVQGNHFDNADTESTGNSDDDYVEDADDEASMENLGVDEEVENPGVETVEETRRSSRSTREPERFADTEHSAVFFQAVDQYRNIDATMSSKQYGLKAGLKVFGEAGLAAVASEIRDNLHGRGVIEPVKKERVTSEIRKKSLPYLMFLKRKRCGKIKGRGCADGRKQREFISKEEASSPTVSTHALMATCLIDAIEGRNVATADIPGAFLQATMDEDVWIKFEGAMVDVLLEIDPERYGPCVCTYNGRRYLYAKAIKAIYGAMRSALLFYQLFSGQLKEWDFKINEYDACTMNKMVNGSQLTIVWHVDDCKISHRDEEVVTDLLEQLEGRFGKETPIAITRGRIHDYLGMTIDYSIKSKVKFYMFDYIEQILGEVDSDLMKGSGVTPAGKHLFQTHEDGAKLNKKEADAFHRNVARLLFLSKRARPDIQTAVAFLCTRVQSPDVHDNLKLGRVMRYLRETIFLPLILGWDGTGNIYWSVDASFAVHNDMKSHTGAVMTLGVGALLSSSTKQKLNTTSSTEAELVGVSDSMPFNIWAAHFFEAQGRSYKEYKIGKRNILFQDNESCIKLAKNGKASSSRRTRHIHIRYFFITDRVKSNEVEIHYCPTKEMLSDFFTKPLQGALFKKFRDNILGITDEEYRQCKEDYYNAKKSKSSVTFSNNNG